MAMVNYKIYLAMKKDNQKIVYDFIIDEEDVFRMVQGVGFYYQDKIYYPRNDGKEEFIKRGTKKFVFFENSNGLYIGKKVI